MSDHPHWSELAEESRAIWEQNAPFWDEQVGAEGNTFHRLLVAPATERLLALQPGERVLDVACGNGNFTRRLAALGAQVVAFDQSAAFIERARTHPSDHAARIAYHVLDAADAGALLALATPPFDAAVANMALMDMPALDPLLDAVARVLTPNGRFIFSITHPCFNSIGVTRLVEEEDRDGQIVVRHAVKTNRYLTPTTAKGQGIIGQPAPHYYFHRPISLLLQGCFRAGFVLDGLEEPAFAPGLEPNRPFSWSNYHEIPPALVVRLRPTRTS